MYCGKPLNGETCDCPQAVAEAEKKARMKVQAARHSHRISRRHRSSISSQYSHSINSQHRVHSSRRSTFDSQYGEDWKITYEEKKATKLSQEKVDQLTQEYQRDPITVYPKSVFPVIYMTGSKDEQKLKDWFCQEEVKEAYEVTVDMKIEGSKGEGENEAKAIVVNYGGDWILYGNSSPDALVYELEFH